MGNSLVCPNCGSTDVYCGGLDPVRSLAKCRCCGCYAEGMLRIDQLFSSSRTASDRNQALKDEEKRRLSEEERRKKLIALEDRMREERRQREASCSHEWTIRIQSGVGYRHCVKCGKDEFHL